MEFESDTTGLGAAIFINHLTDLEKLANGLPEEIKSEKAAITEALNRALIDPNEQPKDNPLIASIDSIPFATLGNFSCIIGKAKSKKTFFITLIVAAFLKGLFGILQAYKSNGKSLVIWFDTEQSRNHVTKAYRRALKIADGSVFHEIEVYDLRPHSPKERLEMIDHVLRDKNKDNDVAFVVIDGIRDLVTDINDPVQATDIVTWLMKITEEKGLHVCTVLHQNKGDNNARGHLGTEIVNKAETVLSVQKESDIISLVKAEFCRDREFKPFAFSIDEATGIPSILTDYYHDQSGNGSGQSKLNPMTISDDRHRDIMAAVFVHQPEYSYTELIIQAKIQYAEAGYSAGDNKIKGFVRYCDNLKIIRKNGNQGSKAKYILNQTPGN